MLRALQTARFTGHSLKKGSTLSSSTISSTLSVTMTQKSQVNLSFHTKSMFEDFNKKSSHSLINGMVNNKNVDLTASTKVIADLSQQMSTQAEEKKPEVTEAVKPASGMQWLLSKLKVGSPKQIVVEDPQKTGFNRWLIVPAAVGTHISLGSIFAWSIFNQPLMTLNGVVASSASDWELSHIMPIFSTTMAFFGLSSFLLGRIGFSDRFGPRVTGLLGSGMFAGAFSLSALAVSMQSLPLLYLGYGVLGGLTVGTAYVGPISTLMKWFPDRKGLASAMAVMGFGAGGMVAAPCIDKLLRTFQKAPEYLGKITDLSTVTRDGRLYAEVNGQLQEIVVATQASLAKLGSLGSALQEGAYIVGTGSTGAVETFMGLGILYSVAIFLSAFIFRLPPDGYNPASVAATNAINNNMTNSTTPAPVAAAPPTPKFPHVATLGAASPADVLKARQFWLVWAGMCFNSAAAYAIIGAGKTMMVDMFSGAYPLIVTSTFAATFVSMISVFNLSGRLAWGSISDKIGTKMTFNYLWGLGIPLYLMMPFSAHLIQYVNSNPSVAETTGIMASMAHTAPLALFYGAAMIAISTFGGSAAVSPAYLADLFGGKNVAAIHGQLLSFLLVSGYLGPMTCSLLREYSMKDAIHKLSALIDSATFERVFGSPISQLDALIEAKTVTIARLMEIVPAGTQDPTPFLYDYMLVTMCGLQFIAFACNLMVRKVDPKFFVAAKDAAAKVVAAAPKK